MPFDGSGNFNRVHNWVSDAAAAVKIRADRHDAEDDNLASGLSACLTKDGQSQPTANIPMNGMKLTNLGAPTNPADAATKAYVDADITHSLPGKTALVDADEMMISNSESTPAWQRAKVTVASLRASVTPIGMGGDFWGPVAPAGWLFCYGQAISRTTYAKLFAALGTAHGAGDGTSTFNLPDKRGRASFGKDDMGGTSADRLTALAGGINGDVLGAVGGEQAHVQTIAQMPSHDHTPGTGGESTDHAHYVSGYTSANGSHAHTTNYPTSSGDNPLGGNRRISTDDPDGGSVNPGLINVNAVGDHQHTVNFWSGGRNAGHTHAIYAQGGGAAFNVLPPGIVCNYIIFAGV